MRTWYKISDDHDEVRRTLIYQNDDLEAVVEVTVCVGISVDVYYQSTGINHDLGQNTFDRMSDEIYAHFEDHPEDIGVYTFTI